MTVRACPACERRLASLRGQVGSFWILECRVCGTLYADGIGLDDPREVYAELYSDEDLAFPGFIQDSLDRLLSAFEPYRSNGNLLGIGFGGGLELQAAARAGWNVEGIEVSESAVKHARSQGISAFHGELQEAKFPDEHFDVVMASEVLEHVHHPRPLLEEAARVLRPGGLLWATTPNGRGLSRKILGLAWSGVSPPEHLQLFSPRALRHMLTTAGFEPTRFRIESLNPSEIIHELEMRLRGHVRAPGDFDRTQSGYEILQAVYRRRSLTVAKRALDEVLAVTRLGDSLRVWATKTHEGRPP